MFKLSSLYLFILLGSVIAVPVDLRSRALPTPISASTARTYLSARKTHILIRPILNDQVIVSVTVAATSNSPAYARSEFKTWDTSVLSSSRIVL